MNSGKNRKKHQDHLSIPEDLILHEKTIADQKKTIAYQKKTIADQRKTIADQRREIAHEKKKTLEITEILYRFSKLMSRAIELRDPYTKGHSEHVAEISTNLISIHKIDELASQIEMVRLAALIHDIGKLGINEFVLNKPTILTEAEFIMIKHHTILGYRLIEPFLFDSLIGEAVLSHHENYDGSGYPSALRGEEIPLIARLIRIADFYDALTSERPYRHSLKPMEAIEVMEKNSNWFDPNLLSVFIKNLKKLTSRSI
jgi:putative nucleotidyltransferase with HDIG domain